MDRTTYLERKLDLIEERLLGKITNEIYIDQRERLDHMYDTSQGEEPEG